MSIVDMEPCQLLCEENLKTYYMQTDAVFARKMLEIKTIDDKC